MAIYNLRYFKNVPQAGGGMLRLEIYRKDYAGQSMEIGDVLRVLALEIQGQQDEIDAPIVKTSLTMTFVDAPDMDAVSFKTSAWEEFYTSDSVLWLVVLKCGKAGTSASLMQTLWSGFVTPDSYAETLSYRGDVTIVARDNIGHMQDFPFDAVGDENGMISLHDLVEAGWAKIESPMVLNWRGDEDGAEWLKCNGQEAYDTLMNVSFFKEKNWYEAVEAALYAYGAVLRYVGNNRIQVCSLRDLPKFGKAEFEYLTRIQPLFEDGAERELIPAAKRIEEKVDYDLAEVINAPQVTEDDFTGQEQVLNVLEPGIAFDLVTMPIKQSSTGYGWRMGTNGGFFNPKAYDMSEVKEYDKNFMWLASSAYTISVHEVNYVRECNASKLSVELAFGSVYRLVDGVLKHVMDYPKRVCVDVFVKKNGVTLYLDEDGAWVSEEQMRVLTLESGKVSLAIPTDDYIGNIVLGVRIHGFDTTPWNFDSYVPMYSLSLVENRPLLQSATVNTNYNEANNIILSRDPQLAPARDEVALPQVIKNGIFYRNGGAVLPAKLWAWRQAPEQQMAVYNHLQLLCYYAKPFNMISGTILNATLSKMAVIYEWNGAEHILVSGRLNFLTGHIEGAILREFYRYEDLWGNIGGPEMPAVEEDRTSTAESSSSSSNTVTYTASETVNIASTSKASVLHINVTALIRMQSATKAQLDAVGLTESVISNMLSGAYTKVVDSSGGGVWDYTAYKESSSLHLYLHRGDGFVWKDGIVLEQIGNDWEIQYNEL